MDYRSIEKLLMFENNNKKNEKSLQICYLYRKLLIEFIIQETNLQKYENIIKNSDLAFSVVKKNNMDYYQLFSIDKLNYFYLRNELYVENLKEYEIQKLDERINSENYEFDDNIKCFIKKTYRKILKKTKDNDKEELPFERKILYDNLDIEDGTLILGFKFDEFGENDMEDKEWLEIYKKRIEFINSIFQEVKKEIEEKLSIPVEIIKY